MLLKISHLYLTPTPEDVLNRLDLLYPSPSSTGTAHNTKKQYEKARHLAKYVFPRQYGLPSPFVTQAQARDAPYSVSDADRESQIKVRSLYIVMLHHC